MSGLELFCNLYTSLITSIGIATIGCPASLPSRIFSNQIIHSPRSFDLPLPIGISSHKDKGCLLITPRLVSIAPAFPE